MQPNKAPRTLRSLRWWLAPRFAGVAALPLVVVAAFAWFLLLPRIRADVEIQHQALAQAVAGQVETYLLGAQRDLTAIAAIIHDRGQRPASFWFGPLDAHVSAGETFKAIYSVNTSEAVHTVGLPEEQRSHREDLLGLDLSGWTFLGEARARNAVVWSETFLSAVSGQLTVALALPVANGQEMVIGEISIDPLSVSLGRMPGHSGLLTVILDHRGQIIADSRSELGGQQRNLSHLPIVRGALRGRFLTDEFALDGAAFIGTAVGIPHVGWTVLVAQPRSELFRQISSTLWAMAVGLVVALLLAAVAGFVLARSGARMIQHYTTLAHAIADGDHAPPPPTSNIAEFAALANDLQRMAHAIRQRERALAASESRFRDLSAMALDWFWEQDEQLRFTYFSSGDEWGGLEKNGIDSTDFLGKTRWEMPAINLTPTQWAAHRALLDAHQPFRDFEYCLRLDSGEEHWLSANGRPLFDASGRFIGYRGTGRDITERKRAEERQRLAAAVCEAAREAIVVTDIRGRIVATNPAFTAMSGYSEAEVLGRTPRFLQTDDAHYAALRRAVVREGVWQGEFWNRCKDGELRVALAKISSVRDATGRLTHYVGIATDISHQKETDRHIERLAYYDALTNLPNRALFTQRAELALALAARQRAEITLLFLDLDRFKEVNDALGHAEGDALLVQAAQRLQSLVRKTDTICRLGGDEFVLLLPDTGQEGAQSVVNKVLAAFRQPFPIAGHHLRTTVSVGVALYPHDGRNLAELLKYADTALYRAKQDGRNTGMFYASEMNAVTFERLILESQLRKAIETDQLVAYFQPKIRLRDSAPVGAEALVRWRHPEYGLIPPGRFIPVAEASDLIVALGDWMLTEACQRAATWRAAGLPPLTIAVNVVARHFRDPGCVTRIEKLLATHGLAPHSLELELTESNLLEARAQTMETLLALQQLKVELVIDDFGTGYSSLSYLKRLPITALKIDQSFVRDLATDAENRVLAATIIALGHSLGLKVVAEGVETEEQRRILLDQGCDFAQGYLFSPPLPACEFVNWISRYR